jgi:hypothetical protein
MHADAEAFFSILIFILIHFMMDDDGGMGAKAIIKNKRYHKIEEIRVSSVLQCLLPASVPEGPKARRPEGRTNEGFHCFLYYYIYMY